MNCQWFYRDTFEERFDVRGIWEEDILIVDEDTGIVYQGHQDEGPGDMLEEVEDFLRRGVSTGSISLMETVNAVGADIKAGGRRRG